MCVVLTAKPNKPSKQERHSFRRFDIINPIQISAKEMDKLKLKKPQKKARLYTKGSANIVHRTGLDCALRMDQIPIGKSAIDKTTLRIANSKPMNFENPRSKDTAANTTYFRS